MLKDLKQMPSLPTTNESGLEFNSSDVIELYNYGASLIKKYYRKDPAEFGLEILYAILRTIERAETSPKAYFRQALLYRVLYQFKIEAKRSGREVPVGEFFDSLADIRSDSLYEDRDIKRFLKDLDPRLSQLVNLLMDGYSYREAADLMKVGKSQVGNDVKQIRQAWIDFNRGEEI